jgi:A/G-specific adenine glycosylase
MKTSFTSLLMQWHTQTNKRQMPWKGEKDPYKIWLSEIILQQTRVEQGWAYYEKFIKAYPTIQQLAKAKDETVFKLWEGLGYYNRCRNLLHTARTIVKDHNGTFPKTYESILELKGIGPYTASAIASFAFNLPYAVVDGNVFRVLSRVFGIDTAIDSNAGKNQFTALANEMLDQKQPGPYNQAIMDFGATVCKPALPLCNHCPIQKICVAYKEGKVNQLPVKEKVLTKKHRWFYYFIFEVENRFLVHKRQGKDIWQDLHEFYLLEADEQIKWSNELVKDWLQEQFNIVKADVRFISPLQKQQLTHQEIKGQFIKVGLKSIPENLEHYAWVDSKKLKKLAFPKFINLFLDNESLQQSMF